MVSGLDVPLVVNPLNVGFTVIIPPFPTSVGGQAGIPSACPEAESTDASGPGWESTDGGDGRARRCLIVVVESL